MTTATTIAALPAENEVLCTENNRLRQDVRALLAQVESPRETIAALRAQVVTLTARVRDLEGQQVFCRIRGDLSTMRKQGVRMLTALESVFLGQPLTPCLSPDGRPE